MTSPELAQPPDDATRRALAFPRGASAGSDAWATIPRWLVPIGIASLASAALGMWAHVIATTTYLYDKAESSVAVSVITIAQVVTTALVTLPAGRMLDRAGPRRSLFLGAGALTCATLVASAATSVGGSVAVVGLVVAIGCLSAGTACYSPVMQATIPGFVTPERVAGVVTMQFAVVNAAQIVGPPIGTFDFGLSLAPRFLVNLVFFVPLVLFGVVVQRFAVVNRESKPTPVRSCLRFIRNDPYLRFAYKVAFSVGVLMDPPITLGPALGESLSNNSDAASIVLTAFAVGSTLGGLRSRRLGAGLGPATQSLLVAAIGFFIAAAAPNIWIACFGLFLAGCGFLWLGSALMARVLERIDPSMRGQLMALWGMSIFSGRILATLVGGAASDLTSPQVALAVIAAGAVVIGLLMRRRHRRFLADGVVA